MVSIVNLLPVLSSVEISSKKSLVEMIVDLWVLVLAVKKNILLIVIETRV